MKANEIKTSKPPKEDVFAEQSAETNSVYLESFFDLLFKIDKRNHPELYEHNKSGASPDQTSKGSSGICLRGD